VNSPGGEAEPPLREANGNNLAYDNMSVRVKIAITLFIQNIINSKRSPI
jgi:hypothetical protein